MRLSIPVSALIALLVSTGGSSAGKVRKSAKPDSHTTALANSNNFTCNEPFLVPAEYIDTEGNSFAMCLSDPRFHRKTIIWYIQALNGSYKAVGVAKKNGHDEFVGTVIPIEQPSNDSGMHADPVHVRVNFDRPSGVVTVRPRNTKGQLVNWIIRPNGFPAGSLKVPESCGQHLETLKDPKLLSPLTGATGNSKVCIIPGHEADAFISWGSFKNDHDADPLSIDGGIEPNFFSMGFVGMDRGVSIDICDPGNDDANRCEMSRLVGHTRKTFVVGNGHDEDLNQHQPIKSAKLDKKKFKKQHKIKAKSCDIPHPSHAHEHEARSNALIQKIDMIEHDIKSILERSNKHEEHVDHKDLEDLEDHRDHKHHKNHKDVKRKHEKAARCHLHEDEDEHEEEKLHLHRHHKSHKKHKNVKSCGMEHSDYDDHEDAHSCHHHKHHKKHDSCHVKQHKVKQCNVAHPLLRPQKLEIPAPIPQIQPPRDNTRIHEQNLMNRFNRLHQRLNRLDHQVSRSESIIAKRLINFNNWLKQQRSLMETKANDFKNFLKQLQYDVVYNPKSKSKRSIISGIGKTIRKAKKIEGLFEGSDAEDSLVGKLKSAAGTVKDEVIEPAADKLGSVTNSTINAIENTAGSTVRTAGSAANAIGSTVGSAVSNTEILVGSALGTTPDPVVQPAPVKSKVAIGSDRFDFNDDLLPPARATLATSPSVSAVAANPLGPVGPVMPTPAVKSYEDPISAAIDYLN